MKKSKIVHVPDLELIKEDEVTKDKKINIEQLNEALDSISRDAVKVNSGNYLAARRFRVNTVAVEKSFKLMRENSPVKKKL